MRKIMGAWCAMVLLCFCIHAGAQSNFGKPQGKLFKHLYQSKLNSKNAAGHSKSHKKATKKVPVVTTFLGWDYETDTWDTSEIYTSTWNADGIPQKLIMDIFFDNEKIRYTITDFVKGNPDNEGEFFPEIFGGENYIFRSALGQEYSYGRWINSERYTVKTTPTGQLEEIMTEYWNTVSWEKESKTTYTYNAADNILTDEEFAWNGTRWVNDRKITYTYDANENLIMVIADRWDDDMNNWVMSYGIKKLLTYNSANQITAIEVEEYSEISQQWRKGEKQEYVVNAAGEITEAVTFRFIPHMNDWQKEMMYSNISWQRFDKTDLTSRPIMIGGDNNMKYADLSYWFENKWHSIGYSETFYNAAGFMTLNSNYQYIDDSLVESLRTAIAYYPNNDEKENQTYDLQGGVLEHTDGYDYVNTYDNDGDITDKIFRQWNSEDDEYENYSRTLTSYTTITVGIEDQNHKFSQITLYPNPVNNGKIIVNLSGKTSEAIINVYDMTGKNVLEHKTIGGENNILLDVTSLPKGLYSVSIHQNTGIANTQFIIR